MTILPKRKRAGCVPVEHLLRRRTFKLACRSALIALGVWWSGNPVMAQQSPRLIHRWEIEPNLKADWLPKPIGPSITLDPSSFSSPVREVRLAAARKVIRYAVEPDLVGRTASLESILEQLKVADENPTIQLSLASAAIHLADANHAPILWERLGQRVATRQLIERELIKWKSPLALDVWRARLKETHPSHTELVTAIEGILTVGSQKDVFALEALLRSDRADTALKVILARAIGKLSPRNLESLASQVTAATIDQHALIVAELLAHHESETSREQLIGILNSDNLAAQEVAYATIAEHFGDVARQWAPKLIAQPSHRLRLLALEVLQRYHDADSLRHQAPAIDDHNSTVRNRAREHLLLKAQIPALRPIVDEAITLQLNGNSPRAIVQAIVLLVALEERQRCARLIQLLDHPDIDISMTAAWGLQALVDKSELLDVVFRKTEQVTKRLSSHEEVTSTEIMRQAYLFEAFGRNRYRPALKSLKLYIPKDGHRMGDAARAAAIWAIGKINEGGADAVLAKELAGRALDQSGDDPEDPLVQYTSVIALGYLRTPTSVDDLNKLVAPPGAPIAVAREWSLKQLKDAQR